MATLALQNVTKSYGGTNVITSLSMDIAHHEFIVFVGFSGCGKSTLIRMIAGLEDITSGNLLIDGGRVNDIPPADRGLAMVFQSYALYPHMTVRQNMSFALRLAHVPREERDRKVAEAARILHLEAYLDRKPGQLSGGQRQRVAIGRAIVRNPKVFLFDEPLSNLDAALRYQMRIEIARLHEELGATLLYVTHDQVGAMTMADRIVVLQNGRIEQVGTPLDIYQRPANLFVARFMGAPQINVLPARVTAVANGYVAVELPGGAAIELPMLTAAGTPKDKVSFAVRPEGLRPAAASCLTGVVNLVERLGAHSLLHVNLDEGGSVVAQVGGGDRTRPDERIRLAVDVAHCHVFDEGGQALTALAQPSGANLQ